jgi:hypothetical protein
MASTDRHAHADDAAALKVGDLVVHAGRRHLFMGADPAGVDRPLAHLEDVESGVRVDVALTEVERVPVDEARDGAEG